MRRSHKDSRITKQDDSSGFSCHVGTARIEARRTFTSKELSQLYHRDNAHVAYRGKVYNVSSFVSQHPGGLDQIMMGAGRDITQVFESYHNHQTVEKVLNKYYVGELVDNELPVFHKESEFFSTLKKRVKEYMVENKLDPKVDYKAFSILVLLTAFLFVNWHLAMTKKFDYFLVNVFFAAVWGLTSSLFAMTCFHDVNHYTITHKPWVWNAVMTFSESVLGTSSYCWRYQHVFGHHPYTNVDKADPDIHTSQDEQLSVWRIKSSQKWIVNYLYQHLYMPLLYSILGTMTRLLDFYTVYVLKKGHIRLNPPSTSQWISFWMGKILHVSMRFIVPFFFMTLGKLVLLNIVYDLTFSFWLALVAQVNHVTQEVDWPQPDKNNVVHLDWAEMQVRTTQDYCTESWIWFILSGGLNHQTSHHLFPGTLRSHYRWITPIVKQTCKEFGIKYNCTDSFTSVLSLHFGYLKKMGKGDST